MISKKRTTTNVYFSAPIRFKRPTSIPSIRNNMQGPTAKKIPRINRNNGRFHNINGHPQPPSSPWSILNSSNLSHHHTKPVPRCNCCIPTEIRSTQRLYFPSSIGSTYKRYRFSLRRCFQANMYPRHDIQNHPSHATVGPGLPFQTVAHQYNITLGNLLANILHRRLILSR